MRSSWSPGRTSVLVVLALPFLYPFFFLVATALKPLQEFNANEVGVPSHPTLHNIGAAWHEAGLGECSGVKALGYAKAFGRRAYVPELAERLSSKRARFRGADRFLEQRGRLPAVPCVEAVLGCRDASPDDPVDRVRRRQGDRALGELGGGLSGAAPARVRRRRVEGGRDLLVGTDGRDREMTGALLRIDS